MNNRNTFIALKFKLGTSAHVALQQIKDNGYLDRFKERDKQLVAVAMTFGKREKGLYL
jgi:hypothetical protein